MDSSHASHTPLRFHRFFSCGLQQQPVTDAAHAAKSAELIVSEQFSEHAESFIAEQRTEYAEPVITEQRSKYAEPVIAE